MKPYAIVSDIHAHAWTHFATTGADGLNTRLKITLDELRRAVIELQAAGGNTLYVAGDVFHTRGSMDPEVFNPTHAVFQELADEVSIRMIPGNHDLKGRDTTKLGNAIQTIGAIGGIEVVTGKVGRLFYNENVLMLPWHATKDQLRATIKGITDAWSPTIAASEVDLIIHVGIDGMLDGVPDSGLSAKEVASWGFKRVFAGDYHNYREAEDGKVISIGATSHQQWGDIGTKAGFLLVYPDRVDYRASHAPSFVELTGDTDPNDYFSTVDGNYVRIRGMKLTDAEINTFRAELTDMGARGVTFQVTREVVSARGSSTVAKATTLDQSVDQFVDQMKDVDPDHLALIKAGAAEILATVRSVAA